VTNLLLKELEISNFRSIRGQVHAPLDAQVVLVHGENGAGKTSLLSAIELALTGGVQSLRRADPGYATQLLHRSAGQGSVALTTSGDSSRQYSATLTASGIASPAPLEPPLASFFSERSYLPQALLGQLLQIYQESSSGADSPLARFVGELLRLDRLDAIESGLKPLGDVRNVRKVVDGWSENELETARLEALINDQNGNLLRVVQDIASEMSRVRNATLALGLTLELSERDLEQIDVGLSSDDDERAFGLITDRRRQLASIRREIAEAAKEQPAIALANAPPDAYRNWETTHGERYSALRTRVESLLIDVSLPGDMADFAEVALRHLTLQSEQAMARRAKAATDAARLASAKSEVDVARLRLKAIDEEVVGIPAASGGLASILSELTSFIDGEICPVCERDYAELQGGTLVEHVHGKVRSLSSSAQRLLDLGRTRADAQALVDRLDREIAALEQGVLDPTLRA
jgi:exonuclease SbcC